MSLRKQFESLLEPELMEGLVDTTIQLKIMRGAQVETLNVGPLPPWFTLYELKLALWNLKGREPAFAPPLVFIGKAIPKEEANAENAYNYIPVDMIWMTLGLTDKIPIQLDSPVSLMVGQPDTRFVDSAGGQKAIGKDNRIRMTLNDVFQLDEGVPVPELHVFLYADLVDRIPGPRPLGERDAYGRIMPYFPFLDPTNLPPASGQGAITKIIMDQAAQTAAALKQAQYLGELLQTLGGEYQMPKLDGIKFLRWVWSKAPEAWEGPSILFFGTKVTHERPYMRFFPASGQPLTKIRVRGVLPIPDLSDPNLLLNWKQDKNPDVGKDCSFLKLCLQTHEEPDTLPLYSTMRVFNDGTADLLVLPPKQKRLLDPYSDLQDAPEALAAALVDISYVDQVPSLGQADVVFKIRMARDSPQITKAILQKRLKAFSSIFQEIPALPDEQPLAMLRYKGVSNFSSEDRIFAFLTQIAAHEMVEGEIKEDQWVPRVADEFKISLDEARKQVVAWTVQKNEYTLAVPETKDYILNKNPGVDVAIFAQHPIYNFHIYRIQSFQIYKTIVNLLGLLISAPANRFTDAHIAVKAATVAKAEMAAPTPVVAPSAPGIEEDGEANAENAGAFFPDADDVPEFMRQGSVEQEETANANAEAFFPNNDDVPEFMRQAPTEEEENTQAFFPNNEASAPTAAVPPPSAAVPPPPVAVQAQDEEDKQAAKAFEKPADIKALKVKKYYIERLKQADPELFDYTHPTDRGYVSYCAANESRQPIVLDNDEYREMRDVYDEDDDLEFVVYPEDSKAVKFQKKQPSKDENTAGKLEAKDYPGEADKEVVTVVRYGSKAKRLNYYLCPRLFCIRDRLMVRFKDFKKTTDRKGKPKPANTCPFCKGTLIPEKIDKETDRDPNSTILQRKPRPGSESERQIYIGFLGNKKNPSGISLPCCFADPVDRFNQNDPEFVRLGLRAAPGARTVAAQVKATPLAQTAADTLVQQQKGRVVENEGPTDVAENIADQIPAVTSSHKYEPNYYRVIQGVSVKSIVDSNRIPLEIIVPKLTALEDPKAGPQIGLLPEALDTYFTQDSTSDKFADRLEIVRKLKPTAKGFLRLAVDNSRTPNAQPLLSAIAPFINYKPTAEKLIEEVLETRIPPKHFLQLNAGNLVHEFFNKCEKKHQNDMRSWVAKYVGIDELKSSNIPAIERLMNSYECFTNYIQDPSQRKDLRVLYQAFSEPGVLLARGILFIVLEVSVEDSTLKTGDKSEFKRDIKFERVRCPPYPLSEGQQKADIGFIVHYSQVTRDRYNPERKLYSSMGWEPLFYVDGSVSTKDSRHKPTLRFQRSEEASWPPIVQRRVSEFFYNCAGVNRGPYTSQFGMDPSALIAAQELIMGLRIQPSGIIRDSYNHLVGLAYKVPSRSEYMAVPIADDGSVHFERRIFLDWDDFQAPPADVIVDFYNVQLLNVFSQYRGYIPRALQKSRDTGKIIGVTLQNGISIPATEPRDPAKVSDLKIVDVDDLEWDINRTIAYDSQLRKEAFENAEEDDEMASKHIQLKMSNAQDEIEDVYQHLRISFSNWLSTAGAGRDIRSALSEVLKNRNLPLFEKRKRVDILLEDKVMRWFEPKDKEEDPDIGFLRVDCLVQDESDCTGRCKWSSENTCKIHTPAKLNTNGIVLNVPRMLYLRLVDELIRFASKREELFQKQVPRLTIRQESQRQGDQYIVPEGTPDWNAWWEFLRSEWMTPEKDTPKFFDEQYEAAPVGLPGDDTRGLPPQFKEILGIDDPKTAELVWNESTNEEAPFLFLRSVIRNHPITSKSDHVLTSEEMNEIKRIANVQILYIASGKTPARWKNPGATEALVIGDIDGKVGWVSQKGTYSVKIPLIALPNRLNEYRV